MTIWDPRTPADDEPFRPVALPSFGGLNLRDDPQEVGWQGAIDLRNVDLDDRGRLRQRDGYTVFGPSMSPSFPYALKEYPRLGSNPQLLAIDIGGTAHAISQLGETVATTTSMGGSIAVIGTSSATYAYIVGSSFASTKRWDGTAFSTPAGMPVAGYLAVQPADNRLVAAYTGSSNPSRVQFSGAGTPETWGVDDFVDLLPGDGESISNLVAWQNYLFVFKKTKFFVFYGNSTDSTGGAVFNYRTVGNGVGSFNSAAAVVADDGVYFVGNDGLYRTTGGDAERVGRSLDPFFRGVSHVTLGTFSLVQSSGFFEGRIYLSIKNTANAYWTLVYDIASDAWLVWDLGVSGFASFTPAAVTRPALHFGHISGLRIGYVDTTSTTDNGSAIDSYYATGFSDLGAPMTEKVVREVLLDGTGSVGISMAVGDSASYDAAGTVTLGTSPAVGNGRRRSAQKGRNFSLKLADVSGGAWSVSRVVAHVMGERPPSLKS